MLHLTLLETLGHCLIFVNLSIEHHSDLVQLSAGQIYESTYLLVQDGVLFAESNILIFNSVKLFFLLQPTFLGAAAILHKAINQSVISVFVLYIPC